MFENKQDMRTLNGKFFLISTVNLSFVRQGFETMIFECGEEGNILTGEDFYEQKYNTFAEATKRHKEIVAMSDEEFANLIGVSS